MAYFVVEAEEVVVELLGSALVAGLIGLKIGRTRRAADAARTLSEHSFSFKCRRNELTWDIL